MMKSLQHRTDSYLTDKIQQVYLETWNTRTWFNANKKEQ